MKTWETPQLKAFGSLEELTQQSNKIGYASDLYSGDTPLVGSIVPASGGTG